MYWFSDRAPNLYCKISTLELILLIIWMPTIHVYYVVSSTAIVSFQTILLSLLVQVLVHFLVCQLQNVLPQSSIVVHNAMLPLGLRIWRLTLKKQRTARQGSLSQHRDSRLTCQLRFWALMPNIVNDCVVSLQYHENQGICFYFISTHVEYIVGNDLGVRREIWVCLYSYIQRMVHTCLVWFFSTKRWEKLSSASKGSCISVCFVGWPMDNWDT